MERQRLVLDANILIRGCLGLRVRALIAHDADQVDFFGAEANVDLMVRCGSVLLSRVR